jgi:hypothetical protein
MMVLVLVETSQKVCGSSVLPLTLSVSTLSSFPHPPPHPPTYRDAASASQSSRIASLDDNVRNAAADDDDDVAIGGVVDDDEDVAVGSDGDDDRLFVAVVVVVVDNDDSSAFDVAVDVAGNKQKNQEENNAYTL